MSCKLRSVYDRRNILKWWMMKMVLMLPVIMSKMKRVDLSDFDNQNSLSSSPNSQPPISPSHLSKCALPFSVCSPFSSVYVCSLPHSLSLSLSHTHTHTHTHTNTHSIPVSTATCLLPGVPQLSLLSILTLSLFLSLNLTCTHIFTATRSAAEQMEGEYGRMEGRWSDAVPLPS